MDCSATSALKAQKVTEWAFPRETEGIVKTWLLSFSLLIHCDLTESREIFHLYSIRCTRSSFCMHANNFHSWSFFGIFSMYKQLAKSGACAAYWHPNSYCHSLHFEFLPDISKRLHMPNSPNAANAMTDPATCHANFLLWNSPKHSSNYVELTVTHGSMLISNFAASNHFTMFKSNITLYHFVSLSWEIPESPNWVVGPARGLAKEAAPQLAKITKKKKRCVQIPTILVTFAACNKKRQHPCLGHLISATSPETRWQQGVGLHSTANLGTESLAAVHVPRKTCNVGNITGISKMRNPVHPTSRKCLDSYSTAFINLPCEWLVWSNWVFYMVFHQRAPVQRRWMEISFGQNTQAASEARCLNCFAVGTEGWDTMERWCAPAIKLLMLTQTL